MIAFAGYVMYYALLVNTEICWYELVDYLVDDEDTQSSMTWLTQYFIRPIT